MKLVSHLTYYKKTEYKHTIGRGVALNNGAYLCKTDLAKELNKEENKYLDTLIEKLEVKELIVRVKKSNKTIYYVNPFLFMTGEEIDSETFALFYKSVFNIYRQ